MRVYKNLFNKGFTLVELLVVIAIIAILFAVVLVAINPAQRFKDSRNSRRLADVKSIVEAATTYTADRRGAQLPDVPDYQCVGSKPATVVSDASPIPRAHWKFDNDANSSVGSFNGTTSETNYSNPAKLIQGLILQNPLYGVSVSDTVDDTLINALTVEGWMKLNQKIEAGTFDHHQTLFDKGNYHLQLNSDSGMLELEIQNGALWSSSPDYDTSSTAIKGINAFTQFQDALYAGGIDNSDQAVLLKKSGGSWSIISNYPAGQSGINALAAYNGKLFSGQTGGRVYEFNGSSWSSTNLEALIGSADVLSLAAYRGKLYAGLGSVNGAAVWVYDGVSWRVSKQFLSSEELAVYTLFVFNEKLYAGTGRGSGNQGARLFEYNGNLWVPKLIPSDFSVSPYKDAVFSLKEYNKELYIGLGGSGATSGAVRRWTESGGVNQVGTISQQMVLSLSVFNGTLIAGVSGSAGDGDVYAWDGSAWNVSLNNASSAEIRSLYSYRGKLYAGARGANENQSGIWTYGSNGFIESQKTAWQPNVWYHIAGVYDGGNTQMKLVINGSVDSTQSGAPSTITPNNSPLYLGIGYGSDALSGVIDDFAVHHFALSADTIASRAGCYNLGQYLAPEYMGSLPIDPSSEVTDGSDTGYFISKDTGGVITITAPLTETTSSIPEIIKASR